MVLVVLVFYALGHPTAAALFWRLVYLSKLESPQSRARIAADWLLDLFYDPPVAQIRRQQ